MSMKLDPAKKWTDDERDWAINRNMHEEVRANDERFGRTPFPTSTESGMAAAAPANQDHNAIRPPEEPKDREFAADDYESWKVDDLKRELDGRMKAIEDDPSSVDEPDVEKEELRYSSSDKKDDLIGRLRQNDKRYE